jgi:hypothetical protein
LSGEVGDLVMLRGNTSDVSLLELLHEGRLVNFLRLSFARSRRNHGQLLPLLLRVALQGYWPQLGEKRRRERYRKSEVHATGAYREPTVAERVTAPLLARARESQIDYPSHSAFPVPKRPLLDAIYRFADHPATTTDDMTPEIWKTFPFTHRPLVEFVLAAPQLAFWSPTISREGMRRALAHVLPPEILTRRSKGNPTTASARHHIAAAATFVQTGLPPEPPAQWRLVARGYLEPEPLREAIKAVAAGLPPAEYLRVAVNLEAWLRRAESVAITRVAPESPATAHVVGALREAHGT